MSLLATQSASDRASHPTCQMLRAIDFDRQTRLMAVEIEDVAAQRMLPAKLDSKLVCSELLPQHCFRIRGFLTQILAR